MYSQHFGLTQDPFSIAPDPRYLFMSERHREALAHLLYGVAGRTGASGGVVLLTGDIGTGKTTVCRCFLEQIPPGCQVAYIFNPKLTVTELLQSICDEFHVDVAHSSVGAPTVKGYIDALNVFLLQQHAAGQSSVLIIDEAQNLSVDVLEQLRLLTNLETNERKLLQIVLIGQTELRTMLARPDLEQLAQRVIARFHLDALTEAETRLYIEQRLVVAGHTGALPFDLSALTAIYRQARGVPRRINLLCGRALLGAWATGHTRVNRKVVAKAAFEVFGPDRAVVQRSTTRSLIYALSGAGLLGGALFAGLAFWERPWWAVPVRPAVPVAIVHAEPVVMPASAAVRPVVEIDALLPSLPRDLDQAWRNLALLWKFQPADADPCQSAQDALLICYRTTQLTLPLIRQLGQPGIFTLQIGTEPPVHALLVGLNEQTALLHVNGELHKVRLVSLARLWNGDFATYWRPPQGYTPDLPDGSGGPVVERLALQLAKLDGAGAPVVTSTRPTLDRFLRTRIKDFQRAQGLLPDGKPGPMTFMQMDSATGMNEPRLQSEF
jgi:general secretion pathway protein A